MPGNSKAHEAATFEVIRMAREDFSSVRVPQIEGILRAIRDAVQRVKISLILPRLIEDRETLNRKLTGTQFEPALKIVSNYARRREIILKERRSPLMDHGMINIIDYFQLNSHMYTLFPTQMNTITEEEQKVLIAFEMLLDLAGRHLMQDAPTKIKVERSLHKNFKAVKEMKHQIELLKLNIEEDKLAEQMEKAERVTYLAKLETELSEEMKQVNSKLRKDSDLHAASISAKEKQSLEKQNGLKAEVISLQIDLKKQTVDLKKSEKLAREEKNKTQLQLESIIKKYDFVIGEKTIEHLNLQEQLNIERKKLNKFMAFYLKEEAVYNKIVIKRENEEESRKQDRILRYMMNRAARIIQQYWRIWQKQNKKKLKRLNKMMRKKSKKRK